MKTVREFYEDRLVDALYKKHANTGKKVVIPEGDEIRVIQSLRYTPGFTKVLIGDPVEIEALIDKEYSDYIPAKIKRWVEIVDVNQLGNLEGDDELLEIFLNKRKGKVTEEQARELLKQPNYYATLLLEAGRVGALVGGSRYSTADILKPAFQIVKTKPGHKVVSSVFLLRNGDKKVFFGDCAVNLNPTSEQLKEITIQTVETMTELEVEPKVAMLSYSSKGSGSGPDVDLVVEAYNQIRAERPDLDLIVDGELQFDAAFKPEVAKIKVADSPVAGHANGFIFPNLAAGNIAAKVAEHMGGYEAVGPILQGLNKPVNDLSRGTTPETIAKVVLISLR
ncbi:phosphotransacetylase [Mollicutes bacterium LVI A0039]|nr:phosphotransacetylase [Mollicutes bacterium LVI A0039]